MAHDPVLEDDLVTAEGAAPEVLPDDRIDDERHDEENRLKPRYISKVRDALGEAVLGRARVLQVRAEESAAEREGERPVICLFSTTETQVDAVNHHLRDNGFGNLSRIQRVEQIEAIPVLGTGKTDFRSLTDMLKALLAE